MVHIRWPRGEDLVIASSCIYQHAMVLRTRLCVVGECHTATVANCHRVSALFKGWQPKVSTIPGAIVITYHKERVGRTDWPDQTMPLPPCQHTSCTQHPSQYSSLQYHCDLQLDRYNISVIMTTTGIDSTTGKHRETGQHPSLVVSTSSPKDRKHRDQQDVHDEQEHDDVVHENS